MNDQTRLRQLEALDHKRAREMGCDVIGLFGVSLIAAGGHVWERAGGEVVVPIENVVGAGAVEVRAVPGQAATVMSFLVVLLLTLGSSIRARAALQIELLALRHPPAGQFFSSDISLGWRIVPRLSRLDGHAARSQ